MKTPPKFYTDPEMIISIGEKIICKHTNLGPESPLHNGTIADLNSRISRAKEKHEEGLKYKKLMEDAWRDRDLHLGNEAKGVISILKSTYQILDEKNLEMH